MIKKVVRIGFCLLIAALGCGEASVRAADSPPIQTFLVFFDSNSANVTKQAAAVVRIAAAAAKQNRSAKVTVIGNCDTAELNADRLSQDRADAVARMFKSFTGQLSVQVLTHGLGARNLLAPTGPNVPQPLNRRVVIELH